MPVVGMVTPVLRERLFCCEHFGVWRIRGNSPFTVGAAETPRVLVCIAGHGQLEHHGAKHDGIHGAMNVRNDIQVMPDDRK